MYEVQCKELIFFTLGVNGLIHKENSDNNIFLVPKCVLDVSSSGLAGSDLTSVASPEI